MGHTRLVPDLFLSPADTRLTQNPKKKSADMSPKKVPGVKNRSTNDDRRITFLLQHGHALAKKTLPTWSGVDFWRTR